MKPAQTFFFRHSIIFPDKARACFSHMSSDIKQILDLEVAQFSHRMTHNVSKVSSSLLTETLKKMQGTSVEI